MGRGTKPADRGAKSGEKMVLRTGWRREDEAGGVVASIPPAWGVPRGVGANVALCLKHSCSLLCTQGTDLEPELLFWPFFAAPGADAFLWFTKCIGTCLKALSKPDPGTPGMGL